MDMQEYFPGFLYPDQYKGVAVLDALVNDISLNMPFYMKSLERLYIDAPPGGLSQEDVQTYLALLKAVIDRWADGNNDQAPLKMQQLLQSAPEPVIRPVEKPRQIVLKPGNGVVAIVPNVNGKKEGLPTRKEVVKVIKRFTVSTSEPKVSDQVLPSLPIGAQSQPEGARQHVLGEQSLTFVSKPERRKLREIK